MTEGVESEGKVTDQDTVDTYNKSAEAMRNRYENMTARRDDIERGFSYVNKEKPVVVEIGFGSGREARIISQFAGSYTGIDVSSSMVDHARESSGELMFLEADVVNYEFPREVDIIFAFASLLHLPKETLRIVFQKIERSLTEGGVLYISLKRKDEYSDEIVRDEFGSRHFYYYSRDDMQDLAPSSLEEVYYDEQLHADQDWFTIIFKKMQR